MILANGLTSMLPAMLLAKALDTTRMHRAAGHTGDRIALIATRPWWSCPPASSPLWHQALPLTAQETYVSFSS
jgi:hypothetical protein